MEITKPPKAATMPAVVRYFANRRRGSCWLSVFPMGILLGSERSASRWLRVCARRSVAALQLDDLGLQLRHLLAQHSGNHALVPGCGARGETVEHFALVGVDVIASLVRPEQDYRGGFSDSASYGYGKTRRVHSGWKFARIPIIVVETNGSADLQTAQCDCIRFRAQFFLHGSIPAFGVLRTPEHVPLASENRAGRQAEGTDRAFHEQAVDLGEGFGLCDSFTGVLELSFRGVKSAIEDTVDEFDSGLVQAIYQEQNDRSHQQRPDPSGQWKGLLNDIEFLLELEDW